MINDLSINYLILFRKRISSSFNTEQKNKKSKESERKYIKSIEIQIINAHFIDDLRYYMILVLYCCYIHLHLYYMEQPLLSYLLLILDSSRHNTRKTQNNAIIITINNNK